MRCHQRHGPQQRRGHARQRDRGHVHRDNDVEPIRDASAFALKLYESLLESVPKNQDLLVATCGGFTQYTYAFVHTDAIVLGEAQHDEVVKLNERALNMYIRAKDYCLRAMELRFSNIRPELAKDPVAALKRAKKEDVELLYWTAASWGSAISLGVDKPELVIDLPTVRALAERALALDPTWSDGAIHEMMIALDSLPEAIGGSPDRAREHFKHAIEIQKGKAPGPNVALALGVSVPTQNVEEFKEAARHGDRDRSQGQSEDDPRHAGHAAASPGAARTGRPALRQITWTVTTRS